jgi:thymidylate kinase
MNVGFQDGRSVPPMRRTVPTPVESSLSTLGSYGIDLALLRVDADQIDNDSDVDVLVRPSQRARARRQLLDLGWLEVPSSGHGSHRFFTLYSPATRSWHQLDLVSSLDFGNLQAYRTDVADACLDRVAHRADGLPVLHPDDAFWSLFAHLAWKEPNPTRDDNLKRRGHGATVAGPVAAQLAHVMPGGRATLERVLVAVCAGEWEEVRSVQRRLRRHWARVRPLDVTYHAVGHWLRRRTAIRNGSGLSLALLGLDGAGKTTVASALRVGVPWPTVTLYMGVWRTSSIDRLVQRVVGAQLLLRLGRLLRVSMQARYHRSLGRLVVLDRYIVDATLPSPELDWKGRVSAVLVQGTASQPDRMVFLDAPPDVVYARKGELGLEELRRRRDYYRQLGKKFPQLVTVDSDRPLQEVLADVHELVWQDFSSAQSRRSSHGNWTTDRTRSRSVRHAYMGRISRTGTTGAPGRRLAHHTPSEP